MKKHPFILVFTLICIIISLSARSQVTKTLEDGTTKTTTILPTQPDGTTVTIDEFRTADKTLRGFRVTKTDAIGNTQITDSITTPGGRPWRVTTIRRTAAKETIYAEERNYDDRGQTLLESQVREYNSNGIKLTIFKSGESKTTKDITVREDPGPMIPLHPDRDQDLPMAQTTKLKPKLDVFGGYSYLYTKNRFDNISFPVGGHISLTIMLTKRFGLLVDGSYHTKKENDLRIARAFLMGGMMYNILKNEQQKLILFARLMAGLAADRQKYNFGPASNVTSAKAFAIAVGLGLAYPVNSSLFLCLIPDYINNKFGDDNYTNIRITAALKIFLQGQ